MDVVQQRSISQRALKRTFDIIVSFSALLFLIPILFAIALAILVTSPGPIIYKGKRVGLYGRRFFMYKFRTMVIGAETIGGTSTGKNDPRITPIGYFLRKYKLDELPQLINVLKGEMSLVGPRPEVEEYVDLYTEDELLILTMRPGITDYSSLKFRNLADLLGESNVDEVFSKTVLPEKNRLRLEYIQNASFTVDIRIIWNTIGAIIRG